MSHRVLIVEDQIGVALAECLRLGIVPITGGDGTAPAPAPIDPAEVALVRRIFADPAGRRLVEDFTAKNIPGATAAMPHLAVRAEVDALKAELVKEREDRAKRDSDAAVEAERRKQISAVQADPVLRVRAEDIEPIEKLMRERGVMNYRDASTLYRNEQRAQIAAPRSDSGRAIMPGDHGDEDAYHKKLWAAKTDIEREKLAKEAAFEVLDDFRNGRGSKWADMGLIHA